MCRHSTAALSKTAEGTKMKSKLVRAHDGMLTYKYGNPDMTFNFHLLCEVGQPWQPEFKMLLDGLHLKGYTIETRELPCPPWVADYAIKVTK